MDNEEMQMNNVDKKKLEKVGKYLTDKNFSMYEELCDINESLKKISEKEMPEMPHMEMPEVHKVEIAGAEVLTIKGERGKDGRNPLLVSETEPANPQIGDLWYQP